MEEDFSPYGKPGQDREEGGEEEEGGDLNLHSYGSAYDGYRFPKQRKKKKETTSQKSDYTDASSRDISKSNAPAGVYTELQQAKPEDDSDDSSESDDSSDDTSDDSDEDEDQTEPMGRPSTIESSVLKIPQELSLFSSKYHWCDRFGLLTEQLQSKRITLEKRFRLIRLYKNVDFKISPPNLKGGVATEVREADGGIHEDRYVIWESDNRGAISARREKDHPACGYRR